jgi:type IV pilus assembly protein PilC
MATFAYKLKNAEGKTITGKLQAQGYAQAASAARKLGTVVELNQQGGGIFGALIKPKLKLKDRLVLTEQIAVMVRAGISLPRVLRDIQEESNVKSVRDVLAGVVVDVEGGLPFSAALAKQPGSFSSVFIQMIKGGEQSGNLVDILEQLAYQQQKEYELRGKVRGALIYPAIVSTLLLGVITLVITFVLPRLSTLFGDSSNLPASTRLLLGMSNFMSANWPYVLVGLPIVIVGLRKLAATKQGRPIWDALKLRIPVLGKFTKMAIIARFAQSFAFLAQAGVPMLDIFTTLRGVVSNYHFEHDIAEISRDVENGIPISTALKRHPRFPGMVPQLVRVGEETGDLVGILKTLASFYEKEVDTMAKNLSSFLEPIIMILMGGGIGFVLISVLQPIYGLIGGSGGGA